VTGLGHGVTSAVRWAGAAWWCLVLAAPLAAGAAPAATWDGYTRAGLEARSAGRYAAAEPMLRAALRLAEAGGGPGRRLGTSLTNLADLYVVLHRYGEAEALLRRAVAVEEARVGPGHPAVADVLADYVVVLRHLGRAADLAAAEDRLRGILAEPTVRAPWISWRKSGAGPEELERDEEACVEAARYGVTPYGPLIDGERFTRCVWERGWRSKAIGQATGGEGRRP
jgi:tetratricopeptide (TPR) repeat protein